MHHIIRSVAQIFDPVVAQTTAVSVRLEALRDLVARSEGTSHQGRYLKVIAIEISVGLDKHPDNFFFYQYSPYLYYYYYY